MHSPFEKALIPAAEYVRMSTDTQECSVENQRVVIQRHAADNGYVVVASYADLGKSGVALKGRSGLAQLLNDVVGGKAKFKVVLVYDVSRWGRFQDSDEAAHYEFICKSHGIPVRYCAEEFLNDGSFPTAIMKTLKRTMAAEYSRELGVKVATGMSNLAKKGRWLGATPGLGLRRMIVSPDGSKRVILQDGDQKSIKNYRTILIPGPKKEITIVQKVFSMAVKRRNSPKKIARYLNRMRIWAWRGDGDSRRWTSEAILSMLKNPKYMGCCVYGKTTKKLHTSCRTNPVNERIIVPSAYVPLVDSETFRRVQKVLQSRNKKIIKDDQHYLQYLRRVLRRNGCLTGATLRHQTTLVTRFGSLLGAYERVGYNPPKWRLQASASHAKLLKMYKALFDRLQKIYPESLKLIRLPGQNTRRILEFDESVRVAVISVTLSRL